MSHTLVCLTASQLASSRNFSSSTSCVSFPSSPSVSGLLRPIAAHWRYQDTQKKANCTPPNPISLPPLLFIFSPLLSFPITHTLLLYTPEHFPLPLISFSLSPCHPKFPLQAFAQIPQPARGWHIVPSYWDATHKHIFCHGQIFTPTPTYPCTGALINT